MAMKEFSALTVDFAGEKRGRGKGGLDSLCQKTNFSDPLYLLYIL